MTKTIVVSSGKYQRFVVLHTKGVVKVIRTEANTPLLPATATPNLGVAVLKSDLIVVTRQEALPDFQKA